MQVPILDSINMIQQQLSSLPSLPAMQQFLTHLMTLHIIASQQPITLPSTQHPARALLLTMQQPDASLAQQSIASQQPIALPSTQQPA